MRSLDSTHYKYSSSWDLTFRWQHDNFYYALQIHQADGNIARLLYLFVIWQTPTLRSLKTKKIFKSYSRRSNMMTCLVFFPSENYQSRYQSLRPYNKMVMLTQLGYILKFTTGFCVSVTYFSFLHNRVAVLIMIHAVYLSLSFTFSILLNYIRWRKDSHTSGHLKIGSTILALSLR